MYITAHSGAHFALRCPVIVDLVAVRIEIQANTVSGPRTTGTRWNRAGYAVELRGLRKKEKNGLSVYAGMPGDGWGPF